MKHFVLLTLAMQLFAGCAMADFYLYTVRSHQQALPTTTVMQQLTRSEVLDPR